MKIMILFLIAYLSIGEVLAQNWYEDDSNSRPRSGSNYDWQSGNSYNWNRDNAGNTRVNGFNLNSGSNWNTNIEKDGDMNGFDSKGNYWNYDADSGNYNNFGTGKMCTGKGYARICY